jgi:ankyrin repeat protein
MGNIVDSLINHANHRRDNMRYVYQSKSNHPDSSSLSEISTNDDTEQKSNELSITSPIKCSDFYLACRNNKIKVVKKLLEKITIDEIDEIEPNGSTALHVACYQGNKEIVELLLKAGADRAIFNKFKQLFFRVPNSNRLVSNTGAIDWELINDSVIETATEERHIIKSLYENISGVTPIEKMFEKIEKNYIDKGLTNFDGIENIRRFFQKATKEQDPKWIIKA